MRVLIAEGHESQARSIANTLRAEGFAVDLTFVGEEAYDLARIHNYDLLLLDTHLPEMVEYVLIARLRRAKVNAPILCITSRNAPDDRAKGLNIGADDFLIKPLDFEELLAHCRALVRRGHNQRNPEIVVCDLHIDTIRKSVTREEKRIKLSAREYALLTYLAHRSEQVVSRADICEHLYDSSDEVGSNVIDVYIAYLRNKIDKGFHKKLIHTRHGQGYLLSAEE